VSEGGVLAISKSRWTIEDGQCVTQQLMARCCTVARGGAVRRWPRDGHAVSCRRLLWRLREDWRGKFGSASVHVQKDRAVLMSSALALVRICLLHARRGLAAPEASPGIAEHTPAS
jgi:hypothetical protein